jgi:hypothetical protein
VTVDISRDMLPPVRAAAPQGLERWVILLDRNTLPVMPDVDLAGLSDDSREAIGVVNRLVESLTNTQTQIVKLQQDAKEAAKARPGVLRKAAAEGVNPPADPLPDLRNRLLALEDERNALRLALREATLDAYGPLSKDTSAVLLQARQRAAEVASEALGVLTGLKPILEGMAEPSAAIAWAFDGPRMRWESSSTNPTVNSIVNGLNSATLALEAIVRAGEA